MPLKFDFHMHTLDDPFDHHVYHTVNELVDKAALAGISGPLPSPCIPVNSRARPQSAYARERGILLIPGRGTGYRRLPCLPHQFPQGGLAERVASFADLKRLKAKAAGEGRGAGNPGHRTASLFPGRRRPCRKNSGSIGTLFDAVEVSGFYHANWNPNARPSRPRRSWGCPWWAIRIPIPWSSSGKPGPRRIARRTPTAFCEP